MRPRTKREALQRLAREHKMVVAYSEREDEAAVVAREMGASFREIGAAIGLSSGGARHRYEDVMPLA